MQEGLDPTHDARVGPASPEVVMATVPSGCDDALEPRKLPATRRAFGHLRSCDERPELQCLLRPRRGAGGA